jgi:hypothetical protein
MESAEADNPGKAPQPNLPAPEGRNETLSSDIHAVTLGMKNE